MNQTNHFTNKNFKLNLIFIKWRFSRIYLMLIFEFIFERDHIIVLSIYFIIKLLRIVKYFMVFNSITKKYRLLKISIIMYLWMQSLLFRISRNNSFTFTSLNCSAIFSDRVNVCKSSSVQVLNNVIRLVILFFFFSTSGVWKC